MKVPFLQNFNPPKPLKIYDYQDVTISIFSASIQLHQFNLEKLKKAEIIPYHWQLRKSKKTKAPSLQFSFVEGLNLIIFQGKVILSKKIMNHSIDLETITQKFLIKFTNQDCHQLQMIFRRIITFPSKKNSGAIFIRDNLLNGKEWELLGQKPVNRQVNFYYENLPSPLIISVIELPVKNSKMDSKPCLFFRGIIQYKLALQSTQNRHNYFISALQKYQDNLNNFNQIIDRNLLTAN